MKRSFDKGLHRKSTQAIVTDLIVYVVLFV